MNNFYVITNSQKDPENKNTEIIKKYLEEHGKKCYVQRERHHAENAYKYTFADQVPSDTECVLVLGGDGTLLKAARDLVERSLPFIGINFGTLGYLADAEFSDYKRVLDRLCTDDFSVEDRMMLKGDVFKQGRCVMTDIALNDIVIVRRGHLKVIDFSIYVDDSFLVSYRADGIILSTPTGSTGYSLSVGGPIVAPPASLMLLTPIAAHTLNSRTIILPDNVTVTIRLTGSSERRGDECAEATFDGDTSLICGTGDSIRIRKSQKMTKMIRTDSKSFVEILRSKMN